MPTTKIEPKYKVIIPKSAREAAGVRIGDEMEATTFENSIILTPKSTKDFIARRLAEGEEDIKMGRVYGPFESVEAFKKSLRKRKKAK